MADDTKEAYLQEATRSISTAGQWLRNLLELLPARSGTDVEAVIMLLRTYLDAVERGLEEAESTLVRLTWWLMKAHL